MKEIWKTINGFKNYYEISNFGRVRSLDRYVTRNDGVVQFRKGKLKAQTLNKDGYYTVNLSKNGKSHRLKIHSLVGAAFVEGYFDGAEINHIDCNRKNNYYKNLEWVTHFDNIQHSIKTGNHVSLTHDFTKENNPNYGNHKLSYIYAQNKVLAKEKQSRKGKANGRATPIQIEFVDGSKLSFDYIGECAKYLISNSFTKSKSINSVRIAITKSINENRKYQGIKFTYK